MRKILYIILLLPFLGISQVNFSTYGAIGDGVADDTAELQAALNAESNLIANPGAIFKISSRLNINQGFAHTINWNGATIITSTNLSPMIQVDKRSANGGLTTMSNLNIDGNEVAQRGIECNTRVNLTNFEVDRFRQSTTASPAGVYIHVYNDADCYGDWIFDNVNVSDVRGADNGVTTDSWGAANGYLIYWVNVPSSPTKLIVKNGEVHDCWGEDAQTVGTFSSGIDISYSNGSMEFINMNFYDWERRCVKNFTGNTTWTNCTFTDPSPTNPNLSSKNKSGMVVFGAGSGAAGGDNTVFNNCNFVGQGYDGRVIMLNNDDAEFNNCIWSGSSDMAFTLQVGNALICNSVFETGSTIYGYNVTYNGIISIGTNTTGDTGYVQTPGAVTSYVTCDTPNIPVITLTGSSTIDLDLSDTYTELGATATDVEDGDITDDIVITGTVNTAVEGTYYKYYNVTDSNGNQALEKTRTITVTDVTEETPPTVTNIDIINITSTSATIEVTFDQGVSMHLDYGYSAGTDPTWSYPNSTTNEPNFLTFHRQTISGLTANTVVHFNIDAQNSAGISVVDMDRTFTTLADDSEPEPDPGLGTWKPVKARNIRIGGSKVKLIIGN